MQRRRVDVESNNINKSVIRDVPLAVSHKDDLPPLPPSSSPVLSASSSLSPNMRRGAKSRPTTVVPRQGSNGYISSSNKNNNNDGSGGGSCMAFCLKFTFLMAIVLVASFQLVTQHEEMQLKHLRQHIIHDELEPLSREWEEKYAALEEENEKLKKESTTYQDIKAESQRIKEENEKERKLNEKVDSRIKYLEKYKDKMQQNIKLMSKTALIEKFGIGPHHVDITVAFDPEFPKVKETDSDRGVIKIELADSEEMPHAVYWFLEQVDRRLYDGCSFHRNAGHVLQGGPVTNFLSPPNTESLPKKFKDSGFHSILFQEYSPKYPHEKYTLGYAGRPGGPDFYISMKNNTRIHGPGGQSNYEDPTEADPCFAKIIDGFDVVDRMHQSPVKPGGYNAMKHNVAIVSMRLVAE